MENIGRNRLILEEILEEPFIYRIREAGKRENAYLIVSGEEALAVDPRSAAMLRGIHMLCRGLGAAENNLKIFLTAGCTDDRMDTLLKQLPPQTVVYSGYSSEAKQEGRVHVSDGIVIRPGRSALRCIQTEGCGRGLMSLWLEKKGILFCGDAVGCDHLPPVHMWDNRIDTLGLQFETLRRLRAMPVQMILPGHGEPAGLDDLPGTGGEPLSVPTQAPSSNRSAQGHGFHKHRSFAACAKILDDAVGRYCIRLLEVYQRVPAKGSVPAEQLEEETGSPGVLSFCKYLLYRRYIRYRETESGEAVYERGSQLLTDWGMQQED